MPKLILLGNSTVLISALLSSSSLSSLSLSTSSSQTPAVGEALGVCSSVSLSSASSSSHCVCMEMLKEAEALSGASSTDDTVKIPLSLSPSFQLLPSPPLLLPFLPQSPQLTAVLLFESSHFLDVLVVQSFSQRLQLCREACGPRRPVRLHASLGQVLLAQVLHTERAGVCLLLQQLYLGGVDLRQAEALSLQSQPALILTRENKPVSTDCTGCISSSAPLRALSSSAAACSSSSVCLSSRLSDGQLPTLRSCLDLCRLLRLFDPEPADLCGEECPSTGPSPEECSAAGDGVCDSLWSSRLHLKLLELLHKLICLGAVQSQLQLKLLSIIFTQLVQSFIVSDSSFVEKVLRVEEALPLQFFPKMGELFLVAEQKLSPQPFQLRFLRLCHAVQHGVFLPFQHLQLDLTAGDLLHFFLSRTEILKKAVDFDLQIELLLFDLIQLVPGFITHCSRLL
ncbi:unnamed protein product [Menidia menidia]|uniref:(Atlantic silverside) hypothetical protein n=1 Tax=Menidia menidia TaxID=238744 RepID=A0A8S4AXM2_9TELE|nr:unnamed protein product [Menidia menidia]